MRLDRYNTNRTLHIKNPVAEVCVDSDAERRDEDHFFGIAARNTAIIYFSNAEDHSIGNNEEDQKSPRMFSSLHSLTEGAAMTFRKASKENDKYFVTYYYSQAIAGTVINLVHLFFGPLSIPILQWFYGRNLMHAMVFDINLSYLNGDFTSWLWIFLTIIFDYYNPGVRDQMSVIYLATGSVILLRQVILSLKYGYYSKKEWEKMKTTYVSEEFIRNTMLLHVWVTVPADIAQRELAASFRKQKIDSESMMLKFSYLPQCCVNRLTEEQSLQEISVVDNQISISHLAKYLVHKVTKAQKKSELNLVYVFGMLYVLSFVILRYYAFGLSGFRADPFEIIYTIFSGIKAYKTSSKFAMFIAAGVYDFKRKWTLMAQITAIISKVDHKYLLFKGKDIPELDLTDPAIILNWYHLRRTFLDFGRRYTLRVFLYASLVFPVCFFVVVMLLLQFTGIVGVNYNYYLVPCLMLTLEVFLLLMYMSCAALTLNKTFAVHRDLMLEAFVKAKDRKKINFETLSNLAFVIERLKHDEIVRPVTILGIAITDDLVVKLLIVIMSGLFAVIELAFRQ